MNTILKTYNIQTADTIEVIDAHGCSVTNSGCLIFNISGVTVKGYADKEWQRFWIID